MGVRANLAGGNARGFNLAGCEVIQREGGGRGGGRERERERDQGKPGWGKCKRVQLSWT